MTDKQQDKIKEVINLLNKKIEVFKQMNALHAEMDFYFSKESEIIGKIVKELKKKGKKDSMEMEHPLEDIETDLSHLMCECTRWETEWDWAIEEIESIIESLEMFLSKKEVCK